MKNSPSRPPRFCETRGFTLLTSILFFTLFIAGALYIVTPVMHKDDIQAGFVPRLLFYDRIFLDWILIAIVLLWFVRGTWWLRLTAYGLLSCFILVYVLQLVAVYIGGEYVTPLALDNLNHASLLISPLSISIAVVALILLVYLLWKIERKRPDYASIWQNTLCTLILLGCGYGLYSIESLANVKDIYQRQVLVNSKSNFVENGSPLKLFLNVLLNKREIPAFSLQDKDIAAARKQNIYLDSAKRYPLIKEKIFESSEIRTTDYFSQSALVDKPNVIVLFAEGMSARMVESYRHTFPELTPHIRDFAQSALVVDQYFNHTFATYRGLHGQLCSLFPFHGGTGGWHTNYDNLKLVDYFCLSHLFNLAGYHTAFLDTHRKDAGFVDEMMHQLAFREVINAEDVVKSGHSEEPLRADALSDTQLFDGLIGWLTDREQMAEDQNFFLGMYNLETHTWQHIAEDGKRYPNANNYVLDSIHNYDNNFGRFWQYFQSSKWFDNTMVILTSDHAHYPDRDMQQLGQRQSDYKPFFVDQIPLLIHMPGNNTGQRFNANNASSIDFAPTVAHLAGLPNVRNPFLGRSIFEADRISPDQIGLASGGDEMFIIRNGQVFKSGHDMSDDDPATGLFRVIWKTRELEIHNRVWRPAP